MSHRLVYLSSSLLLLDQDRLFNNNQNESRENAIIKQEMDGCLDIDNDSIYNINDLNNAFVFEQGERIKSEFTNDQQTSPSNIKVENVDIDNNNIITEDMLSKNAQRIIFTILGTFHNNPSSFFYIKR